MVLSKADLISGKDNIQEVKIESLNDTIFLRPLTRGEWDKIEEIETASMGKFTTTEKAMGSRRRSRQKSSMESQGEIDVHATTKASKKAQTQAVLYSINNDNNPDKFTVNDINLFSVNVFNEIYNKVREISGVDEEDLEQQIDDFPENR